jgi:hypothetical protein
MKSIVVLLLLLQGRATATCACRRANAQWILAIRQANAATLDKTVQCVAVKIIKRSSSEADVFELRAKSDRLGSQFKIT